MKLIFVFVLFTSILSFGQLKVDKFYGLKDYPDGKRIAYFNINGLNKNTDLINYLKYEFKKDNKFLRFNLYIYQNYPYNAMMETTNNVSLSYLNDKLSNIYNRYNSLSNKYKSSKRDFYRNLYNVPDFPLYINTGDTKKDEDIYESKKQVWISSHKEKFYYIQHLSLDMFSK